MIFDNSAQVNTFQDYKTDRVSSDGADSALGLLGINYRSTPLELREKASVFLQRNQTKLASAKHEGLLDGAVVVSTCNRSEVIFSAKVENFGEVERFIKSEVFSPECITARSMFSLGRNNNWYFLKEDEVSSHVFRLATGLDSMIVGEAQILGQLKNAYRSSVEEGLIESSLHKLLQSAFRTAKKVRTGTGIGKGTVSVASASKLAIESIFPDLAKLKYLVIGAGETATLMVRHLRDAGASSFFIANRSAVASRNLASLVQGVSIPLAKIKEVLPLVDVVVSAVTLDGESTVLDFDTMKQIASMEKTKTYVLLDLSVPRSIDSRVHDLSSVYLFDIDDFKMITENALKNRKSEADRADYIIRDEVVRYRKWQLERMKYHLVPELFSKFKIESRREWIRTSRKLRQKNIPESMLKELAEIVFQHEQSVFGRFMHPVFETVRSSEEKEVSAMYDMFSIPENLIASPKLSSQASSLGKDSVNISKKSIQKTDF